MQKRKARNIVANLVCKLNSRLKSDASTSTSYTTSFSSSNKKPKTQLRSYSFRQRDMEKRHERRKRRPTRPRFSIHLSGSSNKGRRSTVRTRDKYPVKAKREVKRKVGSLSDCVVTKALRNPAIRTGIVEGYIIIMRVGKWARKEKNKRGRD